MPRKSILVVDDEKNQREILETILSSEGYDVTTASSGEAAMKFVADRHFDLVLSDLKMTGMPAFEINTAGTFSFPALIYSRNRRIKRLQPRYNAVRMPICASYERPA